MMNKIKVDNNKIVIDKNDIYYLEFDKYFEVVIDINENVTSKLIVINNSDCHITYNLKDHCELIVNSLNNNVSSKIVINLLGSNSSITYNYSTLSSIDCLNEFYINHLVNNTTSVINNNGVNIGNNKLIFRIDGIISKKRQNIECVQNSRIINFKEGDSRIIPNLIIDSNEVKATHSAYIGSYDKETKFYLASRGLSEKAINMVLYKALLLGNMQMDEESTLFNKMVKEWWDNVS